jgi:hypothetical protein
MFLILHISNQYPIETASLNVYSVWERARKSNHYSIITKIHSQVDETTESYLEITNFKYLCGEKLRCVSNS